jgi:hypothetical protein
MPRASGRRPPTDTSQTSRSNAPVQSRCCAVAPGGSPRVCASPRAPTTRSVRPGWRRRARGGLTIIGARRARIHTQVGIAGGPHDVDFSGDGRFLWVTAERANRLVLVSVPTGRVARSVATSGPPHDLAVDRRRGRLWVTIDGSSAVGVRSVSTGRLLHRPVLGAAPTTSPSPPVTAASGSATGIRAASPSSTPLRCVCERAHASGRSRTTSPLGRAHCE